MRVPREDISVALLGLLQSSPALAGTAGRPGLCTTITRQVKIWSAVNSAECPWLMLFKGGPDSESYSQAALGLTKYRLNYNLWLYLKADPTGKVVAETTVNNVADALDAAFQSNPSNRATSFGERQTLGGLVNNAWIDGGSEWGREFEDENITVFWRVAVELGI